MITLEYNLGLRDGMYHILRTLITGPRVRRISGIAFLFVFLFFLAAVILELTQSIPLSKEV